MTKEKLLMIKERRKIRREKLINYLRDELRSSTTHGLPYIVNTEIHWLERAYWLMNFAICLTIAIMLLTTQYVRFLNSPVVMSVEMDYFNWNVSYPAITLCPTGKINQELFSALLNETRLKTGKTLYSYFWSVATASLDSIDKLALQNSETAKNSFQLISPNEYAGIAGLLFENFENRTVMTKTNWPVTVHAVLTEMGMCHVVNSNVAAFHDPFKWKDKTMAYVKNNIELSAHDIDFFTQIMNYADEYKVYVHSPDEIALSTTPSYTFDTEGYVYFGYRVWTAKISDTLRHVPVTIRKCRYLDEPLTKRYPVYSYNHCLVECRIRMIQTLCGCVPHFYKPLDYERICDFSELRCVLNHKNEIMRLSVSNDTLHKHGNDSSLPRTSMDCDCPSDCESHVYLKDAESILLQSDMKRLRIGISTFPKVRVMREFIFSTHDMILKTGGVINLCIGSSMISILELILTALRIPIYNLTEWAVEKINKLRETKKK
ncbi:acid-sensing ion channel 5-like [Cydia pomonella]|uniref:acid-sensing ion channel 5-like n=1 Tax=Cydia pomonella TaxID=82600 RepID=UPI002ADD68D2|nr:acid-sensing ion channel 5-like [Cydia pomonella]